MERIKKKLLLEVDGETCIMEDISTVGMRIISPVLFKQKSVAVTFRLHQSSLELSGRICWIKKDYNIYKQSQYQVGIYFTSPDHEYVRLVQALVDETAAEKHEPAFLKI